MILVGIFDKPFMFKAGNFHNQRDMQQVRRAVISFEGFIGPVVLAILLGFKSALFRFKH